MIVDDRTIVILFYKRKIEDEGGISSEEDKMNSKSTKWTDCSEIPMKIYHGRECYDWSNSVNAMVSFQYNEIKGKLKIMSVEKTKKDYKLMVEYEDRIRPINATSMVAAKLGECIGVFTKAFKYSPGERIIDDKRDLLILKVFRGPIKNDTYYHKMLSYKCNVCGYIKDSIREEQITNGAGCPVCNGKIVMKGFNDIPSKEPWMAAYFPGGIDQASEYTVSSGRTVRFKCPYCGRLADHAMVISTLYRTHSIGCPCGDGVSFPEKFVYYLFREINCCEYVRQVSSKDFS